MYIYIYVYLYTAPSNKNGDENFLGREREREREVFQLRNALEERKKRTIFCYVWFVVSGSVMRAESGNHTRESELFSLCCVHLVLNNRKKRDEKKIHHHDAELIRSNEMNDRLKLPL